MHDPQYDPGRAMRGKPRNPSDWVMDGLEDDFKAAITKAKADIAREKLLAEASEKGWP